MNYQSNVRFIEVLVTVFHALALILTSFRLWFRYHIRRLWWDDFWAALALLGDAVCMVTMWTVTAPLDNPYTNIEGLREHFSCADLTYLV